MSFSSLFSKIVRVSLIVLGGATFALGQATVNIQPGMNIPSVVAANPAGTTFVIQPGVYRLSTPINAKNGDTFIGSSTCAPPKTSCPAILNGSKLLTSFQHTGSYYYVTGQTQQGRVTVDSSKCEPAVNAGYLVPYPGCIYPEDLYFDGKPLVHVIALSDVGPGKWFFDYPNQTIYFYDSPSGHTVETSVTPSVFAWGPANNVTIQQLTVEKFAAPIQWAAIGSVASSNTGLDWVVRNNEIRLNHGDGVRINFGWQILNNYIHNNANLGIGGGLGSLTLPSRVLIQGNEIAFNNYAHVSPHFGSGGIDVAMTLGIVLRSNYVHDNEGDGIHLDHFNMNALYDGNTIEHNTDEGIFHEISYAATARNNKLLSNGYFHPNGTFWLYGANLLSSTSQGLDAYCNTIEVSAEGGNGIDVIAQPRSPELESENNYFHHNTVIFEGNSGFTGAARGSKTDICCDDFYSDNQGFDYNTYHLPSLTRKPFFWNDTNSTFANLQAAGQERHGSADTNYTGSVPTVVITSPADGSNVSGIATIKGSAQDDLSKVEFYVDWAIELTDVTSPFSFAWDTTGVTKGHHTVAAMAYDNEGMRACYAVTLNVQ